MSRSYILLSQKLSRLRDVDRILDISKSTLQLEITLLLASMGRLTAVEIAKQLNQRKKAVTDALRKLKLKGLVSEEEVDGDRFYKLSKDGEYCLRGLMDATDLKQLQERVNEALSPAEGKELILRNLAIAFYVYESVVALGTSKGKKLPLKVLAKLVSLSQQRLQTYLDLFTGGGSPCLFKKYHVLTTWSKILSKLGLKRRSTETVYALTDQGLQVLYKLPIYVKVKSTLITHLLRPLLRNNHPREVLVKLLTILFLGNSLTLLFCFVAQSTYLALSACWLAVSSALGGIALLDLYLFNRL